MLQLLKAYINILLFIVSAIACKPAITCKELRTSYFNLTSRLGNWQDTVAFIDNLGKLIDRDPRCEKALQTRGYFYLIEDSINQAMFDFRKALQINRNNIYTLYGLASIYNLNSRNDSAYYFINTAIKEKSRLGYAVDQNDFFSRKFDIPLNELIFFRGLILYEAGVFENSKKDFLKSIALEHEGGEASAYLASIYLKEDNIDSACFYNLRAKRLQFRSVIDSAVEIKCAGNSHLRSKSELD